MVMLAERSESSPVGPNSTWEAAQNALATAVTHGSHHCLLLVCSRDGHTTTYPVVPWGSLTSPYATACCRRLSFTSGTKRPG